VQDVVHDAALASGKLTRDQTGGQLTFPEVIMSMQKEFQAHEHIDLAGGILERTA
jgi:hypothetical protein